MKLSELLKLKKAIDNWTPGYEFTVNISLQELDNCIELVDAESSRAKSNVDQHREQINDLFAQIRQNIEEYKQHLQSMIDGKQDEYNELSRKNYISSLVDTPEYMMTRRKESQIFNNEEGRDLFISRLGNYNSWKYPALEIRPAYGEVTEYIKGCTPLYLIDTNYEMFTEVKQLWNQVYQRRLRYYTFDEKDLSSLDILPDNQIGLICSVDYFNFKPLDIIEEYMQQLFRKLRPGGVVMFTYNNCDLPYGVKNVENFYACYTPESQLLEILKNIGYEIIKTVDVQENISWMEIKKPGDIITIRGGETLGELLSFD